MRAITGGLALLWCSVSVAQSYDLIVSDEVAAPNSAVTWSVTLENTGTTSEEIVGFSVGICSDASRITPTTLTLGPAIVALNGGTGPAFVQDAILANGWTIGVVFDLLGSQTLTLAAGDSMVLIEPTGTAIGAVGTITAVTPCNTLGSPPIGVQVVGPASQSVDPIFVAGSLEVVAFGPSTLRLSPFTTIAPLGSSTVTVTYSTSESVLGFSFGIAAPAGFTLSGIDPAGPLATTNGGTGPDLFLVDLTVGVPGATVECVVSTAAPFDVMPPTLEAPLITMSIFADATVGPACAQLSLSFSGSLGSPAVPITLDVEGAGTITPLVENGVIEVASLDPAPPSGGITLSIPDRVVPPGGAVEIPVNLDCDQSLEALSFGVSLDGTDLSIDAVSLGSTLAAIRCGAGPEYQAIQTFLGPTMGVTFATVFELQPPFSSERALPPGGDHELIVLRLLASSSPVGSSIPITFNESVGNPPVAIEFTHDGVPLDATTLSDGAVIIGEGFTRGDCNNDAGVNIADAIFNLGYLFSVGVNPQCFSACDLNDDGGLDIGDPIYLLSNLFSSPGSAPMIPPPTNCGADPTLDSLTCNNTTGCL